MSEVDNNKEKPLYTEKEIRSMSSGVKITSKSIDEIKYFVERLKEKDLRKSNRLKTYALMSDDPDVKACLDERTTMLEKTQRKGKLELPDKEDMESLGEEKYKEIRSFLKYNMNNLSNHQSPRTIGRSASEFVKNGFSLFEVVYEEVTSDKWLSKGYKYKLKNLSYIPPETLDPREPYVLDSRGDNVVSYRQKIPVVKNNGVYTEILNTSPTNGCVEIDSRYVARCCYNSHEASVIGNSDLDAVYTHWRMKQLLMEYALIGVTRNTGGTSFIWVPASVLEKSVNPEDEEYADARATVERLMQSAGDITSGENAVVVLPSDGYDESGGGRKKYDMEFKGVEGSTNDQNILGYVDHCRKAIYMSFGCQHLFSIDGSGGSYNLHEGKASTAATKNDRDQQILEDMWNKRIFPELLYLNGIKLDNEEVPKWVSGEVQELSIDSIGSFIARTSPFIPVVPETVNHVLQLIGADYQVPPDTPRDELLKLLPQLTKQGSGGSSGTGKTQDAGKGSVLNKENAP